MKVTLVVGTTRSGRKTIHIAEQLLEILEEKGHEVNFFDLKERDVPPMQNRRYREGEIPEDVEEFGQMVEKSDTVMITSPEYNHSIPGPLKNLLDYLYPEYEDKVFSYTTVSAGGFGGVRSVSHLHDITIAFNAYVGPHLTVSNVGSLVEDDGKVSDSSFIERAESFVDDTEEKVRKIS